MKKILFILSVSLFLVSNNLWSQTITLNNCKIDIQEVKFKKSFSQNLNSITAGNKKKYVIIKTEFTQLGSKKDRFPLHKLIIKSNNKEYLFSTSYFPFNDEISIKVKKTKTFKIVALVPKNLKEGDLYFNKSKIGSITVNAKTKRGKVVFSE